MMNKIWGAFIVIGITYFFITSNLSSLNSEILSSTKTALNMVLNILPLMALWMGIMAIAKESGLLTILSNKLEPILSFLFPEIPKGHESLGLISSNIIVNMLGLGNAATPIGLKAMESMQKLNIKKDTASRSMITFLVINTSSVTLIPTTVISLRMMHGSSNPTDIVISALLATICSTSFGILIDRLVAKVKR